MSPAAARARPPAERLAVDLKGTLSLVGVLATYLGLAALVPAAVAVGYSEPFWPFLAAGAITSGGGWLLDRATGDISQVGAREGFLVVALTWPWLGRPSREGLGLQTVVLRRG